MEWQFAFPEPIESIEDATDITALQAYVDAIQTAGEERAGAWTAGTAAPTDDDLDEAEAFRASAELAAQRITVLAEAEANRRARIEKLGFKKGDAPPPPAAAPSNVAVIDATAVEVDERPSGFSIFPEIVNTATLPSYAEGQRMLTLTDQGTALIERANRLNKANTGEKFTVLQIRNYIPDNLSLPEDGMQAFGMLQNDRYDDDGLVAGFCAPPGVDYSFCGGSSDMRPVLSSMRRYAAPRGRVTKMATPLFSSVGTASGQIDSTGIKQWTNANDDAAPFVEKVCSVLSCVGNETFELYSTYKCVRIKNFMALAFPEWVAFNLMQLDALWARFAEKLLLDQIFVRAGGAITATTTYGSWASVLSRLNQLLTAYTENERYESTPGLAVYAPRWLKSALKDDAIRRGDSLSDGEIASGLNDIGVGRITWTMDNPATIGDYPRQNKGTTIVDYPANAWMIVTRPDNLRVMDIGATDIGITTEREYRDTTTNVRNEYQLFVESFEGLIDMGCPVWRFQIPICNNGTVAPTTAAISPCGS